MCKKQDKNLTLVLTGAIEIINNLPFRISIVDTEIRLQQYIDSIEYAIVRYNTIKNIIFCENTDFTYDYSRLYTLAKKFNKNLEILTFKGTTDKIVQKGKGFGEGEVLKYVYDNSVIFKDSSCFVKLTGRLIVTNFDKIINPTHDEQNYFFLPSLLQYHKSHSMSTVLYKVNTHFFRTFMINAYLEVDDKNNHKIEMVYFEIVKHQSPRYFKYYPMIQGQSGSNGTCHNEVSLFKLLKRKVSFRISSVLQTAIIKYL